jgi:hypothetical protein
VVGFLVLLVLTWAWALILVFVHELGHALAALALTDGEVKIGAEHRLGIVFGRCTYDATALRRRRAEAWIAAAGPAPSLVAAAVLWYVTVSSPVYVPLVGAGEGTAIFLLTALPLRYGAGLDHVVGESDGLIVWRVLTGGPPGGFAREERRRGPRERAMRPVFMILLAPILIFTVWADPLLAVALMALFGLGTLLQRPRVG